MTNVVSRTRRTPAAVVAALAVCAASGLLTACSVPNARSAEGDQVGNLGSQVCITNNSSTTFTVAFTTFDTKRGDGTLAPGGESCAEGTTFWGEDVRGSITHPSTKSVTEFFASNQWVGAPWFQIALTTSLFRDGICPGEGWSIGDTDRMQTGGVDFTVTRQADNSRPGGEWKNFNVVISDGTGIHYPDQYCNNV